MLWPPGSDWIAAFIAAWLPIAALSGSMRARASDSRASPICAHDSSLVASKDHAGCWADPLGDGLPVAPILPSRAIQLPPRLVEEPLERALALWQSQFPPVPRGRFPGHPVGGRLGLRRCCEPVVMELEHVPGLERDDERLVLHPDRNDRRPLAREQLSEEPEPDPCDTEIAQREDPTTFRCVLADQPGPTRSLHGPAVLDQAVSEPRRSSHVGGHTAGDSQLSTFVRTPAWGDEPWPFGVGVPVKARIGYIRTSRGTTWSIRGSVVDSLSAPRTANATSRRAASSFRRWLASRILEGACRTRSADLRLPPPGHYLNRRDSRDRGLLESREPLGPSGSGGFLISPITLHQE